MAKGFSGMPGGMNMNSLMKQAQKMQKQMADVQAELTEKTLEVSSGGGMVKAVVGGDKQIKELVIAREVVDPDDIEMLQDLIVTAVNEGLRQMEELYERQMSGISKGLGGMGLF